MLKLPKFFKRREVLQSAGAAAAAGAVLAGCDKEDPFALKKPPVPGASGWYKGEQRFVNSSCAQCPAGCGIRVRVVEGRAVKIEGLQTSPINVGGIGPRGLSGTQVLYDPDRVQQPMRRKGGRGQPSFEPISWDDALALLSERLSGLRQKGESHRLGIACGQNRGMMRELLMRFAKSYGTPNFFDTASANEHLVADAVWAMQGVRDIPAYDWSNTRYILSIGSSILEGSCQHIAFARAQAHLRHGDHGIRSTIVHVGTPSSKTAMNSDQWVSIAPTSHGAFAMGLCHILVREGTYDKKFVEEHGFGFTSWQDKKKRTHKGLKDALERFNPETVAEICKTSVRNLERIAYDIVAEKPSFAITSEDGTSNANGLYAAMAVHALNGLLGAIDRPGGVLIQRNAPLADWPEVELDDTAKKGLAQPRLDGVGVKQFPWHESVYNELPAALESGKPYDLDTLFLHHSNPVYSRVAPLRWRKALEKVPFIVKFAPFLDESASELADLILPDHTYLERWEDAAPAPSVGYAVFGMRQPVVEHLYDTRPNGDVLIDLAKKIGDPVAGAFPWKNFKEAVLKRVAGIQAAQRGSIVADTPAAFNKKLFAAGFWKDDGYKFEQWNEVFRTPSGKFEFFSQNLMNAVETLAEKVGKTPDELLASWGHTEGLDDVCLPHHDIVAMRGEPEKFPYLLTPYTPSTYAEGSGANLPWLREVVAFTGRPAWKTEAEIHPELAGKLGVANGDPLVVESVAGSIDVVAYIDPNIHVDEVRIARGGGHTAMGRWAKGWGANVMTLLDAEPDRLTGFSPYQGTRVSVRRKVV